MHLPTSEHPMYHWSAQHKHSVSPTNPGPDPTPALKEQWVHLPTAEYSLDPRVQLERLSSASGGDGGVPRGK